MFLSLLMHLHDVMYCLDMTLFKSLHNMIMSHWEIFLSENYFFNFFLEIPINTWAQLTIH